jgi:hypothetical protein
MSSAQERTDHGDTPNSGGQAKQTDRLIAIALEECDLFRDPEMRPYARVSAGAGKRVMRVDSRTFSLWLQRSFRGKHGHAAGPHALNAAVQELTAEALFEGKEEQVAVRLGAADGAIFLDLGDDTWCVARITSTGWDISEDPIPFLRRPQSGPLPQPSRDGSVEDLRAFLNVADDTDCKLIVSWLLMALNPDGPYPVLILQGEQGSAKSTTLKVLKRLVDPTAPFIRALPRSERDLAVAAAANWILAFDNISFLPTWLSDALCRLSTGGGFGTRTHYENDEETIFQQTRPIILNGLDAVATRQDLLDRAIVVRLPAIPSETRMPEQEFWKQFEDAQPAILGALLRAVSVAINRLPHTELPSLPRLADFARWVTAAEPALGWASGSLVRAFERSHADTLRASLEGSVVASAIEKFIRNQGEMEQDSRRWEGTPTLLFELLRDTANEKLIRARAWPKNPQALSRHLTLIMPALAEVGIHIEPGHQGRGKDKTRWITITEPVVPNTILGTTGDAGDAGDAK